MATTLVFRFPGGRYHATPWGHHVNEGQIEWPPAPWRILRALIATAFTKLATPDPLPTGHALPRLIESLAGTLPNYRLPKSASGHTRHYMPINEGKNEKRTLVLDAYAAVGDAPLVVSWPVDLDGESRALLAWLAESMSYLGRAESWVEGHLLETDSALPDDSGLECHPHVHGAAAKGPGWEQFTLLCTQSADDYAFWRKTALEEALKDLSLSPGKKPTAAQHKEIAKIEAPYPATLFACLTTDTAFLQKYGWSQPPGSHRAVYWRRTDSLATARLALASRPIAPPSVTCVLLALASNTAQGEVLPLFSRTLPQAEILHRSLVSQAGKGGLTDCPVLIGRDAKGEQLETPHTHVHIIPLTLDSTPGRIDHFLLWAPMGFNAEAQSAIRAVQRTYTKGGTAPIYLTLAGLGSLNDMAAVLDKNDEPIAATGTVWESVTPFVPPLFLKKNGRNSLEGQVNAALKKRGFPHATVELMDREHCAERRFHRYIRRRSKEDYAPPQDYGFGLRLTFSKPVSGPILLGYASHFGLGLFAARS